jgi:hypothetical protein
MFQYVNPLNNVVYLNLPDNTLLLLYKYESINAVQGYNICVF